MITVEYCFLARARNYWQGPSVYPISSNKEAAQQASACRSYLTKRGIGVHRDGNLQAFTIHYASKSHRIITELIISGCPRTCELTINELFPC